MNRVEILSVFEDCNSPSVKSILDKICYDYKDNWIEEGFIYGDTFFKKYKNFTILLTSILVSVGLLKLGIALSRGYDNVYFLLMAIIFFVVVNSQIYVNRKINLYLTDEGKRYMNEISQQLQMKYMTSQMIKNN